MCPEGPWEGSTLGGILPLGLDGAAVRRDDFSVVVASSISVASILLDTPVNTKYTRGDSWSAAADKYENPLEIDFETCFLTKNTSFFTKSRSGRSFLLPFWVCHFST